MGGATILSPCGFLIATKFTKMEVSRVQTPSSSLVPFEDLPNLPKPVIPHIDLGIQRVDVESLAVAIAEEDDGICTRRRVGFFLSDNYTQTESTDVLDLKQTTSVIQTLVQDVGQLRKDLNFAQNVLKADYENRLNKRATELYCQSTARCGELERRHKEKVEIVRKSYKTQLNNAIQNIAGEYQAYYDELLQGKTGRTEAKIRELRQKIEIQELQLEQGSETISELSQKVQQYEEEFGKREAEDAPPPAPPPGISLEEAEELRETVDRLEEELIELRAELAAKEDATKKLTRQLNTTNRQLEDERSKVSQLKRDMEAFKKKTKAEQEKAARMAENQRAALEKEWKEKAESAEKDAARKAEEQAELQRIKEQKKFQEEIDRRKHLENELRSNQRRTPTPPPADGDLGAQVERLQKIEQQQKIEIERLTNELERTVRVWEMKLAIMQRNFHALKDESFIRLSLQRQSASLHHATVGYSTGGHKMGQATRHLKPLPTIKPKSTESNTTSSFQTGTLDESPSSHQFTTPLAPSPTPQHSARDEQLSRNVHFSDPRTYLPARSPVSTY